MRLLGVLPAVGSRHHSTHTACRIDSVAGKVPYRVRLISVQIGTVIALSSSLPVRVQRCRGRCCGVLSFNLQRSGMRLLFVSLDSRTRGTVHTASESDA